MSSAARSRKKLMDVWHQPVIVDNKPGAAGAVGAGFVAKSKPDGYTLFIGTISTHAINASLYKNLSYNPVKDLEPITLVASLPNVLIVSPTLGVSTVAEFIALLKRDPTKRIFPSSGSGTSAHLSGEMPADHIGLQLTHIPYKGTPLSLIDVSTGQALFMFDQLTAAKSLADAGKLKIIAVTTPKRVAIAPNLPTIIESGVTNFRMSYWRTVYAPTGTPKAFVQRLNTEIVKILKLPDVKEKLGTTLRMEIVASAPDDLAAHMANEIPRWAELVKNLARRPTNRRTNFSGITHV